MPRTTPEECLFCRIARKEIPANIACEDDDYVAFHDISPQAPTHILIVPRTHIETLNDLGSEHRELIGGMFLVAQKLAAEAGIDSAGYRTVFNCNEGAGQSVWHVHLHLLGGRTMQWPPG